jgi:hypothetical protein
MITEEELNEIEQRANKAQKSPWKAFIEGRDHESGSDFIMTGFGSDNENDIELYGAKKDDYDFIANARQDIPKLINEIRELRSKIK